jgi:Domain of unknown function (DUF1905)/Bacteriocin-protection, YdeI or OmpD-Associated
MEPQKFSASIYRSDVNYVIDVPPEASQAFKVRGRIPVAGTLNGYPFKATLMPTGEEGHMLFINRSMRNVAGVDEGDMVECIISRDMEPRPLPPMSKEFAEALEDDAEAKAAYEKMPLSHKRRILEYVGTFKNPDTRRRNIKKAIKSFILKKNKGSAKAGNGQ